ncbi:MAG: hypothetical protein UZ17_ACD001000741, partial [Acidobacteria bacterium OLB17]
MKKCPRCGREYDLTMSYCLDDGSELLYGPASEPGAIATGFQPDEPQTEILFSDDRMSPLARTRAEEGFWVAVPPFTWRGPSAALEALAEGLTEDIFDRAV